MPPLSASGALHEDETVYEDCWYERLVKLARVDASDSNSLRVKWLAVDLLTGLSWDASFARLSSPMNEMEVIAYITNSGICNCCGATGGRTRKVDERDYCGSCYRNCCDCYDSSRCPSQPLLKEE